MNDVHIFCNWLSKEYVAWWYLDKYGMAENVLTFDYIDFNSDFVFQ